MDNTIISANGNHYLKPDYLSSMPTTLDAKKSPLALLAQTCSQIGADTPPKHNLEKKKEQQIFNNREKTSPSSSIASSSSPKTSFKPYDLDDNKQRSKTPAKLLNSRETSPASTTSSSSLSTTISTSSSLAATTTTSTIGGLTALSTIKDKYPPIDLLKSPYLYPRICRDPYCTGCLSGTHELTSNKQQQQQQQCPAGCTQCSHVAAAYAHAQLAAMIAQPSYICSWITGGTFCGKRFTTSEELLTHLRSHTADPLLPPHPLLTRSYPTPPLSPLSTARFHPYSKPILPTTLPPFPYSHPGLPPYFSPFSLYGPRLGASHP